MYITGTGVMLIGSTALLLHAAGQILPYPIIILLSWCALCFTSVYWWPSLCLLVDDVRQPIFEEEQIIQEALQDLAVRPNQDKVFRVLLSNSENINAAAVGKHTLIVSTGAFKQLTTPELTAVLAHEMGHHYSGDTLCASAISLCITVSGQLSRIIRIVFRAKYQWRTIMQLAAMVIALMFIFGSMIIEIIVALCIVAVAPQLLWKIMQPIYLLVSRRAEYRQDAFAHALGYGPALRTALMKIMAAPGQPPINRWYVTFHSTHPVTHDRIRRLDQLNWRPTAWAQIIR